MYNPDASLKFLFRGKGGILRLVGIPRREFLRLAGKVLFLECSAHFSGSGFYYTAKYIPGRGGITEQSSRIFPTSDFEWTIAHGGDRNWIRLLGTIWRKEEEKKKREETKISTGYTYYSLENNLDSDRLWSMDGKKILAKQKISRHEEKY